MKIKINPEEIFDFIILTLYLWSAGFFYALTLFRRLDPLVTITLALFLAILMFKVAKEAKSWSYKIPIIGVACYSCIELIIGFLALIPILCVQEDSYYSTRGVILGAFLTLYVWTKFIFVVMTIRYAIKYLPLLFKQKQKLKSADAGDR